MARRAPEVSWVSSLVPTSTRKPVIIINNINIYTHMNGAGEGLALSQNGEAV
jgi:hypothetical protein